ncbi:tRNA modification GTPase [Microdochium nivale]|nr:tRNA modification GTPase [Microdochium nivale]
MHRIRPGRAISHCKHSRTLAVQFLSPLLPSLTLVASPQPSTVRFHRPLRSRGLYTTSRRSSLREQGVHHGDTIYALSTAPGKAGIAVIRISGPACKEIYHALCPDKVFPRPRYAVVRTLYQPGVPASNREILDSEALVLYFPSPRTVTGEDILELYVHGGSATVKAVLAGIAVCSYRNTISTLHGSGSIIRYAEPGEFTRRAFLNDRLDLAQVEALSSTLSAETEQQRRAAVRGGSGSLGRTYDGWRAQLLHARAEMEALIDFSEDQHFDESPALLAANVTAQVRRMLVGIETHEEAGRRGELLRGGIRVALLGPPNAGKSSLMNRLVGREASIVSGESGTTRDVVEARLDIRGYLCTFADTAGFRSAATASPCFSETADTTRIGAIEEEGIRRARAKALESDVIIVLASVEPCPTGTASGDDDGNTTHEIRYDRETLTLAAQCGQYLVVVNKRDCVPHEALDTLISTFQRDVLSQIPGFELSPPPLLISCSEAIQSSSSSPQTAAHTTTMGPGSSPANTSATHGRHRDPGGITTLADTLVSSFAAMTSLPHDMQDLHGVTERQAQLLAQCRGHLEAYLDTVRATSDGDGDGERPGDDEDEDDIDITMAAEQLRYAAACLGRITGRGDAGDVEEILGVIFEKFCVGK